VVIALFLAWRTGAFDHGEHAQRGEHGGEAAGRRSERKSSQAGQTAQREAREVERISEEAFTKRREAPPPRESEP